MASELLRIEDISKRFAVRDRFKKKKWLSAVDKVSLRIEKGETFGLVGESGCGKSTLGRTILRLIEPDGGKIFYDGEDITSADMRRYRRRMQIIFQDPEGALDPRMQVRDIIREALTANGFSGGKAEQYARVNELLKTVGLEETHALRYPEEFSGGQQQRIGIARALAVKPEFIVCDEPVSALDVSYQAQIINLLEQMQRELGLTYLFIAHDLSVVHHISHHIGVMYLGKLVETGTSDDVVRRPAHPYTQKLLSSVLIPDPEHSRTGTGVLSGEVPSVIDPPAGCRFHPRCPFADDRCAASEPELRQIEPGHFCACHKV